MVEFAIGDRVAAFSPMRKADRHGAYAQYTVRFRLQTDCDSFADFVVEHALHPQICLPQATFHVPHNTSFEGMSIELNP